MASKACINRLQKEYKAILKEPVPNIRACPSPTNLLEWHYALEGVKGTPYEGGVYHGKITFPAQYPYRPPGIVMLTPSGRFAVHQKLCLSMSDFHMESWNPLWSVGTILNGLLSFMNESSHTTGSIATTAAEKRRLAKASLEHNLRSPIFCKLFPEYLEEHQQRIQSEQDIPALFEGCGSLVKITALVQERAALAVPETGTAEVQQQQQQQGLAAPPATWGSWLGTLALVAVLLAVMVLPFLAQPPHTNGHIS